MKNIRFAFDFRFAGFGQYVVTYITPICGDFWRARITDMSLIDETRNADEPTAAAFHRLRDVVKRIGAHYSKTGKRID